MIALTEVTKAYFGQPKVLDKVDLKLSQGEFLYVVGGSGAGKTTFLRMLATEELPSAGTVSLFGYNLDRISPSTLRAIRQTLGYIPQNVKLIPDLSVFDNVALSLSLSGKKVLKKSKGPLFTKKVIETLDRLGLGHKKDKFARALSGGEAQRVAIARALVREPDLIVADEPTGAQDREFTWIVMNHFIQANQSGTTVIVATHDNEIVRRVRKPCGLLRGGRLTVERNVCIY